MSDVTPGEPEDVEDDGLEPFRDVPVGTNDPNIVGDVSPLDKPPGTDPRDEGEIEE